VHGHVWQELDRLSFPALTAATLGQAEPALEDQDDPEGAARPAWPAELAPLLERGAAAQIADPFEQPDEPLAALDVPTPDLAGEQIVASESKPLPAIVTKFPYMSEDRGLSDSPSLSLGNVTTGRLLRGVAMPTQGDGFRVLARTLAHGRQFGGQPLVNGLQRAAAQVAKAHPGSVVWIGNLSREGGGDIEPSVSHNSGRDVDVAMFARDEAFRPVDSGDYVPFDGNGQGEGRYAHLFFDAERNWALVRALLSDPGIQVQYIFVADWLRELLIDFASRNEPEVELVQRAEAVLQQPRDSSPHAEHFHVRIYCDLYDRLNGCHDYGVRHPWVDLFEDAVQARVDALVETYQAQPDKRDEVRQEIDRLLIMPEIQPERPEQLEDGGAPARPPVSPEPLPLPSQPDKGAVLLPR
jgi:penicillin-insensitive murein endopeptidase